MIRLNTEFGALLGEYRAMRSRNPEAVSFRGSLPDLSGNQIEYLENGYRERYQVPKLQEHEIFVTHLEGTHDVLSPSGFMHRIGMIGSPIARSMLGILDPSQIHRLAYRPFYGQ